MTAIPDWKKVTREERDLIKKLNRDPDLSTERVVESLKQHLQIAMEIELATIPIYLYTYYSISRTIDTGGTAAGDRLEVYVNEAAGVIMSVAVEEMLHMSLSGNILKSLGGSPKVYLKSPKLPGPLYYHSLSDGKPIKFDLKKFSWEHLFQFLEIELPAKYDAPPEGGWETVGFPEADEGKWDTLGQFYSYIRCLIHSRYIDDACFKKGEQQIGPDNYYANNIDTVYPSVAGYNREGFPSDECVQPQEHYDTEKEKEAAEGAMSAACAAEYPNSEESHEGDTELLTVRSVNSALQAIETICEQGEGYQPGKELLDPTDEPPEKVDTPADEEEESHYVKFYRIRNELKHEGSTGNPDPPESHLIANLPTPPPVEERITPEQLRKAKAIYNFPDNPKTDSYPAEYRELSDLCNLVYQYMLLMIEKGFTVSGAKQKAIFDIGLHKAMIWILDKLILGMRENCSLDGKKNGGPVLAPTFENKAFDDPDNAKQELLSLCNEIEAAANDPCNPDQVSYANQYANVLAAFNIPSLIADLPDVNPAKIGSFATA